MNYWTIKDIENMLSDGVYISEVLRENRYVVIVLSCELPRIMNVRIKIHNF